MPRIKHRMFGVTLVEVLLIVALLMALVLAVVFVMRPRPAYEHARALASAVRIQRWLAVQEGRTVVIRTAASGDAVVAAQGHFTCEVGGGAPVLLEHRPGVSVRWPSAALAFSADGRARRCDGGGTGNTTIDLVDQHENRAAVVVAALGRVRWEKR